MTNYERVQEWRKENPEGKQVDCCIALRMQSVSIFWTEEAYEAEKARRKGRKKKYEPVYEVSPHKKPKKPVATGSHIPTTGRRVRTYLGIDRTNP